MKPYGWHCELVHDASGEVVNSNFFRDAPIEGPHDRLKGYAWRATPLFATKADSSEAKAQPLTELAWDALTEAFIDEYLEDYEMIGEAPDGRDACHTPDEGEKALIKDAVMGLLSEAYEHARNGIASSTKEGGK